MGSRVQHSRAGRWGVALGTGCVALSLACGGQTTVDAGSPDIGGSTSTGGAGSGGSNGNPAIGGSATHCPPGEFGVEEGELHEIASCLPCTEGSFSSEPNQTWCDEWYRCNIAEELVSQGTSTTDTTCQPLPGPSFVGLGHYEWAKALVATNDGLWTAGDGDDRAVVYAVSFDGKEKLLSTVAAGSSSSASDLALVGDDTLVVTGSISDDPDQTTDAFVRRLALDGEEMWTVRFGSAQGDHPGAVAAGPNESVYVAGTTYGNLDAPIVGSSDVFLRKYDANGDLEWSRQFGEDGNDYLNDMTASSNGPVYLSILGDPTDYLRALDEQGELLWELTSDDLGCRYCAALFVADDGDLYVAGENFGEFGGNPDTGGLGDVALARITPTGTVVWKSIISYEPAETITALVVTGDSAYVFGSTFLVLEDRETPTDAFALRFSRDGEALDREARGGSDYEDIQAAAATPAGDIFVAGTSMRNSESWTSRRSFVLPWPLTPP